MSAGHLALRRHDSAVIQLPVMHLFGLALLTSCATRRMDHVFTLVKKSSSKPRPMAKQDNTLSEMSWHFCIKSCT